MQVTQLQSRIRLLQHDPIGSLINCQHLIRG